MENNNPKNIIDEIKDSKMQMHSRQYFIFQTIGKVVLSVLAFLLSIYIISFVLYYLSVNGSLYLSKFGFNGVVDLLLSLPTIIISIAIISLLVVLVVSTRYALSYRNPLIYTFLITVATVVVLGLVVANTSLHPIVFKYLKESGRFEFLPEDIFEPRLAQLHHGLVGTVISIDKDYIIVKTHAGHLVRVALSPELLDDIAKEIELGRRILISGDETNGEIDADDFYVLPN